MLNTHMKEFVGTSEAATKVNPQAYAQMSTAMKRYSQTFRDAAESSGMFESQQLRLNTATDDYIKRLNAQKISFRQWRNEMKVSQQAYKEQLAMQKSLITQIPGSVGGKHTFDITFPTQVTKDLDTFGAKAAWAQAHLKSFGNTMVNWGKNMQWAGRQLMVGFTVPMAAFAAASGAMAYKVNDQLTRITKVYNTSFNSMSKDTVEAARAQTEFANIQADAMNTATNAAKQYGASVTDTLDVQANLAAIGLTGSRLQASTTQVMKAATLGEMDYNTSLQATIALQSIFHQNSKQVADSWNYINSIENATSLSMQDFATAIPIAAGPIKALGGNLHDLGLLMTAMKERGIDASQGANAIKTAMQRLVRPSKQVQAEFAALTGTSLAFIQKKNKDNLVGMFQDIAKVTDHLSTIDRNKVYAGLFGAHQLSRMMAMVNGMNELAKGTGQVTTAFKIGQQSAQDWARTSSKELTQFQQSASGQFKIALQTIKVQLAEMGKPFLTVAADVLKVLNFIIKKFNDLPAIVKNSFAGLAIGAAIMGPVVMLIGLTYNLAGNFVKAGAAAIGLFTKMEILDKESFIAQRAAEVLAGEWSNATTAMEALTAQLNVLNEAQAEAARAAGLVVDADKAETTAAEGATTAIQAEAAALREKAAAARENAIAVDALIASNRAQGLPVTPAMLQQSSVYNNNALVYGALANEAGAKAGIQSQAGMISYVQAQQAGAKAEEEAAAAEAKKVSASKAFAASAIVATAALGTQAVSSNQTVDNIANMAMQAAIMAPMLASIPFGAMGKKIASMAGEFKGGFIPAIKAGGTGIIGMVTNFAKFVGPMGLVAGAVAGFLLINKKIHETSDQIKALGETGQTTWSKVFGYTARTPGTFVDPKTGQTVSTLTAQVQQLNQDAPEVGQRIRAAMEQAGKGMSDAKAQAEAMNIAIRQGLQVINSGGTPQQARQATRASLMAGLEDINKVNKLMAKVDLRVKFNVNKSVLHQQIKQTLDLISHSITDESKKGFWETTVNLISGTEGANSAASNADIQSAADTFYQRWWQVNDTTKIKMIRAIQANNKKMADTVLQPLQANAAANSVLQKYNITSGAKFEYMANNMMFSDADIANIEKAGVSFQKIQGTLNDLDVRSQDFTAELAKQAGLGDANIKNLDDLLSHIVPKYVSINKAQKIYNNLTQGNNKFMNQGLSLITGQVAGHKNLTYQQKLEILNSLRVRRHMQKTANLLDGFGPVTEAWQAKTDGVGGAVNGVNSKLSQTKDLMSQIQKTDIITLAQNAMNSYEQGLSDQTMNSFTNRMNSAISATQAAGQKREQAMQNHHQAQMNAFDARWKKRTQAVTNSYDKRIAAIQNEMNAEKKADDLRQQLFEREMTRLDRLAQASNQNIDFNVALNQGNFDEAAKIRNDSLAQAQDWAIQDAEQNSQQAAQKRQDALQKQIDALNKIKDARLNHMQQIEDKEKAALQRSQQRQEAALKAQVDATNKAEEQMWQTRKTKLEAALKEFTGYTATSTKDLQQHIADWENKYKQFNLDTTGQFNDTTKSIAAYLKDNLQQAQQEFANQKDWAMNGYKIAKAMLQGAFGMNMNQFKQWLVTGVFPKDATPPSKSDINHMYNPNAGSNALANHVKSGPSGRAFHTGGLLGRDKGGRNGYAPHAPIHPNEINVLAEKGEYVVNKHAASKHADILDAINGGHYESHRANTGGAGEIGAMGFAGLMGALLARAVMSTVQQGIVTGATNAMNNSVAPGGKLGAGKAGTYGDLHFDSGQLQNAATIANVGRHMGMNARDIEVGIMTAITESMLRNLNYGDRDSLGLFQQRSSWGSAAQRENPVYAATKFFQSLKALGPGRNNEAPWMEAQGVQRSAYSDGSNYRQYWNEAQAIFRGLHGSAGAPNSSGQVIAGVGGKHRPVPPGIPITQGIHDQYTGYPAIDIGAQVGTKAYAVGDGRISLSKDLVGNDGRVSNGGYYSYGRYMILNLDKGGQALYAHLSQRYAQTGARVKGGSVIGLTGNTGHSYGAHLHFGTRPMSPYNFYPSLKVGGFTLSDGLANLHKDEAVLTKPMTEDFKQGVKNFAEGGNNAYNINVNVTEPNANAEQIAEAVKRSLRRDEKRKPRSRVA